MLDWIYNQDTMNNNLKYILPDSILAGHLHIIKWIFNINKMKNINQLLEISTQKGHLHILEWAYSNNLIIDSIHFSIILQEACIHNKINVLNWIHEYKKLDLHDAYVTACIHRKIHVLEYLLEIDKVDIFNSYLYMDCIGNGVGNGILECLEFLKFNNVILTKDVWNYTLDHVDIINGLYIVQWIYDNGCPT
jgi:hypothetical protein